MKLLHIKPGNIYRDFRATFNGVVYDVHKKIPFSINHLHYSIIRSKEEFMVLELQICEGCLYAYIIGIDKEVLGWIKVCGNDGSRISSYTLGLYEVLWERTDQFQAENYAF